MAANVDDSSDDEDDDKKVRAAAAATKQAKAEGTILSLSLLLRYVHRSVQYRQALPPFFDC